MDEEVAYLGLGTNMGNRLNNLADAKDRLRSLPGVRLGKTSAVYETEPVGMSGANNFLNAVCSVMTSLPPHQLLYSLKGLESEMGRKEKGKMEPRIIDMDLLMYGSRRIQEDGLTVPHPRMHQRRFVLIPLCQIAPEVFHPVLAKNVRDILLELEDEDSVRFYSEFPLKEIGER